MKLQIYRVNNFIKKEIPVQIIFCEFCEISNDTHFLKNPSDGCFLRPGLGTQPRYEAPGDLRVEYVMSK